VALNIDRRGAIGIGVAALSSLSFAPLGAAAPSARKPNIVFIMADDLGYADLSCYGRQDYRTPAVDRLAREGVRLTQAYANSPVCSATRIALMTGRYQYRLRAGLEEPLTPASSYGLPPEQPTLPSLLRNTGYHTSLIGKWHMGALPDYGPLKSGYDEFWGIRGGGVDYFSHAALGQADLWDNDRPVAEVGYLTDLIGQRALDMIERRSAEKDPFFLSLHFTAPHWPWEGPEDAAVSERLSKDKTLSALAHFDGGDMATYAAMVVRMDYQIGRILDLLDRKGIADNTIVIFTSDNGGERFSNVWPFTGRKGELLEGGIRIPAVVRWPGKIPAGSVSEQVTISMDWLPTLLGAAGVNLPMDALSDGINIMPSLSGKSGAVDRTLYWRYLNFDQQACRMGNWKYLKILNEEFLFDVVADPLERANLKARYPAIFAQLTASYHSWNREMLPLDPKAFTHGFSGKEMADHFGVKSPVMHSGTID